jgi:hypothetical protein
LQHKQTTNSKEDGMNKIINHLRAMKWLSPLLLALGLATGCTTATGNKVVLTQENQSKIHKLGVNVKSAGEFAVRYEMEKMSNTGAVIGGLAGLAVEGGTRATLDAQMTKKLKPVVGNLDPSQLASDILVQQLRAANLFVSVEGVKGQSLAELRGQDFDGLLVIVIRKWGMDPCPDRTKETRIQSALDLNAKLFLAGKTASIWERDLIQQDGDCHTVEQFQATDGLLLKCLNRAIGDASGKIVNEIRFP